MAEGQLPREPTETEDEPYDQTWQYDPPGWDDQRNPRVTPILRSSDPGEPSAVDPDTWRTVAGHDPREARAMIGRPRCDIGGRFGPLAQGESDEELREDDSETEGDQPGGGKAPVVSSEMAHIRAWWMQHNWCTSKECDGTGLCLECSARGLRYPTLQPSMADAFIKGCHDKVMCRGARMCDPVSYTHLRAHET